MNALDAASIILKLGGIMVAINFTPYTGYMYRRDNGITMRKIEKWNQAFGRGELAIPGGFLHRQKGLMQISLAELLGRQELDRGEENSFLYFDHPTTTGLLTKWSESRKERCLIPDLRLKTSFYFSPPRITKFNKLIEDEEYLNRENHIFILEKI